MDPTAPQPMTLETLFQLAQAGDEHAIGQLFERLELTIVRGIQKVFQGHRSDDDVEDVRMSTMLAILEHLDKKTPVQSVRSWASTIAHQQAMRFLDKERGDRHARLKTETVSVQTSWARGGETHPLKYLEARSELRMQLERVIPQLSRAEREVYQLHVVEERSSEEVATRMGITKNYVYQHLTQLRKFARSQQKK